MVCLLIPLALWGGGLAWYNAARFGSIFETGHRFQLTGPALPANYSQVASIAYILPNLYNLLARPLVFEWNSFPFVFTPYLTGAMWPGFIRIVDPYYFSEPIAGILLAVPALLVQPGSIHSPYPRRMGLVEGKACHYRAANGRTIAPTVGSGRW